MSLKPKNFFIGPYFLKNAGLYLSSLSDMQGCHKIQQLTSRIRQFNTFSSHAVDNQQNASQSLTETVNPLNAKPFSSIPGPPRHPFIGSLLDYKIGTKQVNYYHEQLRGMYDQYGPVVREDQGSTTIIHIFDPEDIRTVYRSTTVPHVAPLLQTAKDYKQENDMNLGLGNTNGPEWEMLRKAVNKFTLRPQAANLYIPKQDAVAQSAVSLLETHFVQKDGSAPHIEELIDRWITESLGVVVTNVPNCGNLRGELEQDDYALRMAQANRRIFELSAHLKLSTGLYKRFRTPKARALKRDEDAFYGQLIVLCENLISQKEQRRLSQDDDKAPDDSILYRMIEDGALQSADLLTITTSLLTDGYSTTAPTLLGALHCLALSPDAQEAVHQQLVELCPAPDLLTSDTLAGMDRLAACLKEIFRIYPIGDGVQRLLTQPMVLSGYHLPAGTQLDLNPFIWLRDPAVFPDPDIVRLERWSRPPAGGVTDKFHPILNTPFSTGVRTCVGRRLAEHDLSCFIARLLLKFRVSLATPKAPRQIYRVLLRPETPVPLLFHRR